jgi:PAS domain S-box-containing protein
MGIMGVKGNTKAPLFTSPPKEKLKLDEILHPYLKPACLKLLKQAKKGGSQTTDFIQLTGGYICRMQFIELPASKNGQAFICFFECHHKKQTKRSSISKAENIYRKAFHSAPMPLGIFKLQDCTVLEVNQAFLKLTGYTREEVIGISAFDLGIWADRQDPKRIGKLLKDKQFVHNLEVRFRIKSGRAIDTIVNLDLVNVNEEPCMVAVAQDITGIKQTEARLKQNEQLLVSINENLNEGIYRSTPKNGFVYVNKAFARMFGLSVEEAIVINPEKLYANQADRERITKTLATKGYLKNEQIEFLRSDGSTFWGFLSSTLSKDPDGFSTYDGAIVDISDLKRSKILLHEKNDELKKINAELDRFVYSASHDLRAPLSSLLGLVNVTKLENNDPELNNYLDLMKTSVHKLDELIRDIIYFSRNARLDLSPEPIHFKNLAWETINNLKYLPSGSAIETEVEVAPYFNFYSDPKRLRILFNNLISNAFRYHDLSKPAPYIKVNIHFDLNKAIIEIIDNGKGIHPEHIDNIFEMFYRATEDSQGSGLGLYIVKETVEKLRGQIRVHSVPREGTTFVLEIPNLISDPQSS